jgi:hypothetical protein
MGKHVARTQAQREDAAYYEGQQSAAVPRVSDGGLSSEDTERLAQLGRLHEQGVLTDGEFAQQKARILGAG